MNIGNPTITRRGGIMMLLMLLAGWVAGLQAQVPIESGQVISADYRLGPGDELQVDVFNQEDLTGRYSLDGSGRFSMHLIGQVSASGMTASELESLLASKLKPDYLVNPRVSVRILTYRPFYIIGEVSDPSSYPYVDGMTYLNAVAIAGGYTYRAKKDWVWVIPADSQDREEVKIDVNTRVKPGDIIRIAERLF